MKSKSNLLSVIGAGRAGVHEPAVYSLQFNMGTAPQADENQPVLN